MGLQLANRHFSPPIVVELVLQLWQPLHQQLTYLKVLGRCICN